MIPILQREPGWKSTHSQAQDRRTGASTATAEAPLPEAVHLFQDDRQQDQRYPDQADDVQRRQAQVVGARELDVAAYRLERVHLRVGQAERAARSGVHPEVE